MPVCLYERERELWPKRVCIQYNNGSVFKTLADYELLIFSAVTHLVTVTDKLRCCPRTLKFLCAVSEGKWIINFQC